MSFNLGSVIGNIFRPVVATQPTVVIQQAAPAPAKPADEANGLDKMAELFKVDPAKQPTADPLAGPLLKTDPAAIAAAAAKMDFAGHIDPELLKKAMSGDDPAAFVQVLNMTAQRGLAASANLSAATIEQATALNNQRIVNALPGKVQDIQLREVQAENPALNHAAAQPMMNLLRKQVQMNNPGLSAQEINRQAEAAMMGFASQVTGNPNDDAGMRPFGAASSMNGNGNPGGTNWDKWAGLEA